MIKIDGRPYRVIDSHVHIFPDEIVRGRSAWIERDRWFADLYAPVRAKLATAEDLIASMDIAGIDISVVCGFPWAHNDHCREHNAYMADACARFPSRLRWIGICAPGEGASAIVEECLGAGAVGMGEFNADAQGFDPTNPAEMAPIAEALINATRPLLIHCSEPLGHAYAGKGTATPDRIMALVAAFPELTFVGAHWGGGMPFFELMPDARLALGNMVYDSAATTYLYDHRIFAEVGRIAGRSKVLFASDFPVLGQQGLIARMIAMEWPDRDEIAPVMAGNAARVFGIEEPS
jgi:predicted TIM-barrel fold metal-dependent hydrolase